MSATHPDTDTSTGAGARTGTGSGADGVQALDPQQLGAYFVLMEAVSLLQHQVEQQLHAEGDLSYVQFQLLARLAGAHGPLTMTQLADGVVYSRSGLTYKAGLLEKAGPITPAPPAPPPPANPTPAPAPRHQDQGASGSCAPRRKSAAKSRGETG